MLHFLQDPNTTKKIIPSVEVIKDHLKAREDKVTEYFDRLLDSVMAFAPNFVSAMLVLLIGLWVIKRIAILSQKSMAKRDIDVSLRTFLRSLISIGLKVILI